MDTQGLVSKFLFVLFMFYASKSNNSLNLNHKWSKNEYFEQICFPSTCIRHIHQKYRYLIRGRSEYFRKIRHTRIIHEVANFFRIPLPG